MQTEDHPLEYGDFEGVIPEGQYGGGPSMIWDRGTWEPIENPHAGFAKGNLKLRLHGEKLQGAWALIRIKGRDARDRDKTWLLIGRRTSSCARTRSTTSPRRDRQRRHRAQPEEILAARDRIWNRTG
jgi:bifunctional non-homologous end joining protein LigD